MRSYTFGEFGIDEEPYVEEFFSKFGHWPILELQTAVKVPVRSGGRFVMKAFSLHTQFEVTGVEKGKKHPLNIVAKVKTYGSKYEIVITPPFMIKNFCMIGHEETSAHRPDIDLFPELSKTPKASSFHDILKQRQKDAIYLIDLVLF
jgi:hypothetical protein